MRNLELGLFYVLIEPILYHKISFYQKMLRIFLLLDCSSFVSLCKTPNTGVSATGKTRLDKERVALCIAEMVTLCNNNQ